MDERERRLAQNEVTFREVNERIQENADSRGRDEHVYEYLCECSNSDCTLRLELTAAAYEGVRSNSTHFVVAPGHELPDIEAVVERLDGYQVVAKQGDAAQLARRANPR